MEYISSDTNVWIDFFVIGRTEIPFYLPYTFVMNCDAIDDELLCSAFLITMYSNAAYLSQACKLGQRPRPV